MSTQILEGYSDAEKAAYLKAIASIATADQTASDQEITYLANLAEVAGLGEDEQQQIITAAKDTSGSSLKFSLDVLKSSELRFSLVADLIAFAESDNNLVEQEKTHIASIAEYLGINETQLEALNEYVKEASVQPAEAMGISGEVGSGGAGGILGNLGLGDKLKNSGINMGSLAKGLISLVGPMIMGNMLNKGLQGSKATSGLNAGTGGGLGDLLGGTSGQAGGGLGSLIGSLSGGKGFGGIGGFLSNLLK
ncbi:MAG TPA: TerB family tellurite resistance protein [Flavitalea sp.]|nr:TerB family tellurite resistance protein [Flavitalea sp.]